MKDRIIALFIMAEVIGLSVFLENYGCAAFLFVLVIGDRLDEIIERLNREG